MEEGGENRPVVFQTPQRGLLLFEVPSCKGNLDQPQGWRQGRIWIP